MSEKFSATLRIGDLNDYIAPSQGCVVSLKANSKAKLDKLGDFPKIANASTKLMQAEPVKISLKDCLACSGCITSAETVMLEKQSLDEFLSNIDKGKIVIVSLSPQSRASLSEYYGLSPLQVFRKLTTFFKSLGVKALFDTSCSRDLALIESCNEFIARYKQRQSSYDENHKSMVPMISSACPGWICYAEKTLGSYILPYISSVKSPQQTIGAIIKQHLCQKLCLRLLNVYTAQDDETGNDTDFLTNVTRTERLKVLKFGHGSVAHGRDSRYWDRDDRRRDEDYSEEALEHATGGARDGSTGNIHAVEKGNISDKKSSFAESHKGSNHRGISLYNEAGRDELKMYEAEYEASLKGAGRSRNEDRDKNQLSNDAAVGIHDEEVDADDEYDDGIDSHDSRAEDYDVAGHGQGDQKNVALSHVVDSRGSSDELHAGTKGRNIDEDMSGISTEDSSLTSLHSDEISVNSRHVSVVGGQSSRRSTSEKRSASKKKPKRHKFSGSCEMKILNSTSQLVEPLESRKFSRFALQYREVEENPNGEESWVPRFAGHQSLKEREESYIAQDQKINCGFVKGPKGSPSTGFDLAEDDSKYISSCHIAVSSCIFGNSDRLRIPVGKMVSRLSRKNVCFVMFVDEITLHTLSSEGHMPDTMGFIGLWKIVMVKNLPYTDMRRVGKIPKFLPHRLFPSARYSIWLDSKLRLQLDPLLILEYFIWRKGYEYAISNHYDRHCLWEEVAQNKKLNKFNHTIIDEQFLFYQADGLKRFNASDPNKLLPSNVPEGSFIVRAHTPMSNLFSCLWFNEVERFTPRDQLSFAYTYQKLRRTNPTKPFYLNMFKDCERRKVAKLFRHRSEESRYTAGHSTE